MNLSSISHRGLEDLIAFALNEPAEEFISRPSKNFRFELVRLGFQIASRVTGESYDARLVQQGAEIIGCYHSGSLIVDDIEDCSQYRRGRQALHHLYGTPIALNTGNWFYFYASQLIEQLALSDCQKANLAKECQAMLLRAHYGQAIDLGVRLENLAQHRASEVSHALMELKTGVLTGLALRFGAVALGAPIELQDRLEFHGRQLGIALQKFDDVGNLTSTRDHKKRCEDLKLNRLSFVFAVASVELASPEYAKLVKLTQNLPDSCEEVLEFLNQHEIPGRTTAHAGQFLYKVATNIINEFDLDELNLDCVRELQNSLEVSYV